MSQSSSKSLNKILEQMDSSITDKDMENLFALQNADVVKEEAKKAAEPEPIKVEVKVETPPVEVKNYVTKEEVQAIKDSVLDSISKTLSNSLGDKEKNLMQIMEEKIKTLEKNTKIENVVYDPNKKNYYQVAGTGVGSGGATSYIALTDATTVNLPVVNDPLETALAGKQATLVSGTNIKTINGIDILGAGDIPLPGGTTINSVSANTTITITDGSSVTLVDSSGGNINITLPTPTANTGQYSISKTDASTNTVTIIGTVNGIINPTLDFQDDSVTLVSNGTSYRII